MLRDTVQDVCQLARMYGADADAGVLTDEFLLTPVNSAYRTLRRRLAQAGLSISVDTEDLTVPLGTTEIGPDSTPDLPDGFIHPYKLWEKATAAATTAFVAMSKLRFGIPPELAQGVTLGVWVLEGDVIKLVGSTANRTVRIRFESAIALTLQQPTNGIPIFGAIEALAHGALAIFYAGRDETKNAEKQEAAFQAAVARIINRDTISAWSQTDKEPEGQPASRT